jgi:hypothetical protein
MDLVGPKIVMPINTTNSFIFKHSKNAMITSNAQNDGSDVFGVVICAYDVS